MSDDSSTTPIDCNQLEIVLPEYLLHQLLQIAVAKRIPIKELVHDALAQYLHQRN
jgi:hypothetical protein